MRLSQAVALAATITILVEGRGTPGPRGADGANGINGSAGTNVDSIGLLATANGSDVHGADLVRTSGNEIIAKGVASYAKDGTVDLVTNPKAGFTDVGGQKYRIVHEWGLNTRSFYKATDADYFDACKRTLDYSLDRAVTGVGYGKGGPPVMTPADRYNLGGRSLDICHTLIFEGQSGGGVLGGGTVFEWTDPTIDGIRVQSGDTTGSSGGIIAGTGYPGGVGAIIRNLTLRGAFAGVEHDVALLRIRRTCIGENLYFENGAGNGIDVVAYNTSPTINGNANDTNLSKIFVVGCRDGLRIYAPDTNSTQVSHFNANSNRRWGANIDSLIGLNFWGADMSSNGQIAGFPTMCYYGGYWYARLPNSTAYPDNDAWSSANPPTGTPAHNRAWFFVSAGYAAPERPLWTAGQTWRAGGVMRVAGFSFCLFGGFYTEGDQLPACFDENSSLWLSPLGGIPIATDGSLYGGALNGDGSGIRSPRGLRLGEDYGGNDLGMGRLRMLLTKNEIMRFFPHDDGAGVGPGLLMAMGPDGYMYFRDYSQAHQALLLNMATGRIRDPNFEGTFKINDVEVLNGRLAALADLGAAPTQADFNALLIRLRNAKLMEP